MYIGKNIYQAINLRVVSYYNFVHLVKK